MSNYWMFPKFAVHRNYWRARQNCYLPVAALLSLPLHRPSKALNAPFACRACCCSFKLGMWSISFASFHLVGLYRWAIPDGAAPRAPAVACWKASLTACRATPTFYARLAGWRSSRRTQQQQQQVGPAPPNPNLLANTHSIYSIKPHQPLTGWRP